MSDLASQPPQVIVVGLGIAGALTALHLQRQGYRTLVIDREGPAAGCSYGNGGAIGENICAPFTQPGLLRQIPAWYLDPDGPVVVSKTWMLSSVPWITRWLLASRSGPTCHAAKAMAYLHYGCLDIYRSSLGPTLYADLIRDTGYLYAYESKTKSSGELFSEELRRHLGVPGQYVTKDELREIEPALSDSFERGLVLPGNSFTKNPARLVSTISTLFQEAGGTFLRAEVKQIALEGRLARGVVTDQGLIAGDHVVICAGAFSGELLKPLGIRLPLVTERGYHIQFEGADIPLNYKVMNASRGFGATQMETGLQVSGTVELTHHRNPPNWRRAEALARNAAKMFRAELSPVYSRWSGNRPSFPDSLPVVDTARSVGNLYMNFGHSHWGLSGAPQSSRLIAQMIRGETLAAPAQAFSASRFSAWSPQVTLDDPRCYRHAAASA